MNFIFTSITLNSQLWHRYPTNGWQWVHSLSIISMALEIFRWWKKPLISKYHQRRPKIIICVLNRHQCNCIFRTFSLFDVAYPFHHILIPLTSNIVPHPCIVYNIYVKLRTLLICVCWRLCHFAKLFTHFDSKWTQSKISWHNLSNIFTNSRVSFTLWPQSSIKQYEKSVSQLINWLGPKRFDFGFSADFTRCSLVPSACLVRKRFIEGTMDEKFQDMFQVWKSLLNLHTLMNGFAQNLSTASAKRKIHLALVLLALAGPVSDRRSQRSS